MVVNPIIHFIKYDKDLPLQNVKKFSLKSFINPFYYIIFLRKVKQCNIFHYYYTKNSFFYRIFNLILCFLVRFPHGPAIITLVNDSITNKKRYFDAVLFKNSNIIEVFSLESKNRLVKYYNLPKRKITILNKKMYNVYTDYKKAFFINECGHPTWIYKQKKQKERLKWLKQKSTGKKLEIGCATGYIINYVGGDIGIDIDINRLKFANLKYKNSCFVLADASKIPFKDKEFDSILIPEILEHVPFEKVKKIIKESSRVGKRLLITVPNASKPSYNKNLVENPEHLWLPTKEKMFELVGKDIKIEYTKKRDFMLITKLC